MVTEDEIESDPGFLFLESGRAGITKGRDLVSETFGDLREVNGRC